MAFWFFKRADPVQEEHTLDENTGEVLSNFNLKPEYVGREKALNIAALNACVNMIAGDIAKLPIRLYKKDAGKVEEVKDDTRTFLLNQDPGDTLTAVELKKAMITDYYLGKGGYVFINKTGKRFRSLHYVDEKHISFLYNTDPIFKTYSILVDGQRYMPHQFIRLLRNTKDGREGLPIYDETQQLMSATYSLLKYEENQNTTGGNKKGFLKSQRKLAQAAINYVKQQWRKLYSNNADNVMVLNEGMEFQECSNTSMEMQLNQNKITNSKDICKLFLMPANILNGTPTEQDRKLYVEECLNQVIGALECALNRDLLLESEKKEYYFAVDTSDMTKGDPEKRYNAYEKALKNGFMKVDEVRAKENMPPLGLNYIKLGLQDVLFDPVTKDLFLPNMGQSMNLQDEAGTKTEEGGNGDANRNQAGQGDD
jgi:HK97 family phage portal protein